VKRGSIARGKEGSDSVQYYLGREVTPGLA
jgi:hypothetical protein